MMKFVALTQVLIVGFSDRFVYAASQAKLWPLWSDDLIKDLSSYESIEIQKITVARKVSKCFLCLVQANRVKTEEFLDHKVI